MRKCNCLSNLKISSILMALTLALWLFAAAAVNASNVLPPIEDPIDDELAPPEDSCGAVIDTAAYFAEIQQILSGYPPMAPALSNYRIYYVPMTIHIVRTSAGTGGLSTTELSLAISNLNTNYTQSQIQLFQQGSIRYINSDTYYTTCGNGSGVQSVDWVANTINVYFTPIMCDGIAGFAGIGGLYAVIGNLYATGTTFPHEVGHALRLFHTHQPSDPPECPDSSNCSVAGDLVCDTPADPGLRNLVSTQCQYIGTGTVCGGQQYSPDTHNMMSYAPGYCRDHFSAGQATRMRQFLENSHPIMINYLPQRFYVSSAGNDDNIGSAALPFRTIGKAVSIGLSQDTIMVAYGTYTENVVVDGKSLTIMSTYGPKSSTFVIGGSGTSFTFSNGANGSVLDGFRILGGTIGVRCLNSTITVKRCVFDAQTSTTEGAIVLTGNSPATILNNTILRSANWGILTASSAAPTIKNNIVSQNKSGVSCESGAAQPSMSYNDVWDNQVPGLFGYFYGPVNLSNITDPGIGSISQDPFVDSTFWLVVGTPCANAGDPDAIYKDPDGTRACMGAIETAVERMEYVTSSTPGAIQAVINRASSGWVIMVSPGTYYENLRYWGKTIKVRGIDRPTLLRRNLYADIMNLELGEGPGTELSGFNITGMFGVSAIQVGGGANLLIQDCIFHDVLTNSYDVIRVGNNTGLLEIKKCEFYANRSLACIGVWPGSNVRIINNTFYDNNRAFYSNSSNVDARNNIIINSLVYGVSGTYSGLDYNDVWNNATNYTGGAVAGANDISADPLFVNAAAHDFHLQSGSPCINTGDSNLIYSDPDRTRNDMGAYYFAESGLPPLLKSLVEVPRDFGLEQNVPNPFNPSTEIHFSLSKASDVTLEVYNVLGQRVSVLLDQNLPAGRHTVRWEGRDDSGTPVASGVYLYRLTSGEFSDVKKMLLLK